jgi:DNA polymerase (family 10)
MPVHNRDIAEIFNKVADLLDIGGSNPFRVRAYRNAARTVEGLGQSVTDMIKNEEDLSELPGIGKDLAGKIREIVETGSLTQLDELESQAPGDLSQLLKIEGLGPKRVGVLYEQLDVTGLEELKQAAEKGEVANLEGFGEKTQQKILEGLQQVDEVEKRIKLLAAEEIADDLLEYIHKGEGVKAAIVAGSYRRRKETVGDLDILVTCKKGYDVMKRFVKYEDVKNVISKGKTRSTVVLRSGLHVDLRVVPQVSYGAALHYFTGSKAHNIAVRKLGVRRKLKINEYGVFKGKGEDRVAGRTEEEVYAQVDLPYIAPELREDRGEIEAAQKDRLPQLVTLDDISGDLHAHTKETDGHHTLEEMAEAAQDRGYAYLAITDHSKRVTMAHGMDKKRLGKQINRIDRLNDKLKDLTLLKGSEVDILKDGSLDLPDEILEDLDLTVCSVHYDRELSRKKQTERIVRAMDNPYFTILAHPTGRLIGEREPYDVDLEAVMKAAKERGCFLELNAHPDRLDLTDRDCKMAKDIGVQVVISTDAHSITDLDFMRFGVYQARRGWLELADILNTQNLKQLRRLFKRT